jgi:hypothetical protein
MVETLARDKDGTERCDDLSAVVGGATGSKPGDVEARAEAVAAALQETRSTRSIGHGGRREPMGVVVNIEATVKGFVGKHISVTWSLRQANGRRLPHKWLKNRPVLQLTGKATSDTGSADFWVPLPKRPHGPFVVRLTMKDEDGTPLTFAKSGRIA